MYSLSISDVVSSGFAIPGHFDSLYQLVSSTYPEHKWISQEFKEQAIKK
jgi:hypothetical protein